MNRNVAVNDRHSKLRILILALVALLACRTNLESSAESPAGEAPAVSGPAATSAEAKSEAGKDAAPDAITLFDGQSLDHWRIIDQWDFKDHGAIEVKDQTIFLNKGNPATGISWKGELPRSNYEFTWQAQRIEGSDFFCGLTFPVQDSYCTLILGGWGGQIVGLSNIDGFSAIENATTQVIEFENNRWYRLKLRVTDEQIQIWIDDKSIIDVKTMGRKFTIWWEQEPVTPLGIVTWNTTGAIKDLHWTSVSSQPSSTPSE